MNILYIMSSYNVYGGTPKKTLELMAHFGDQSALYAYSSAYSEFKPLFLGTGAYVYEGNHGRNWVRHIHKLLRIIDERRIDIVQTQFTFGEILGLILKTLRPHVRLIVAFVGPFEPPALKKLVARMTYKRVDAFVFVSEYVKREKLAQFPEIGRKQTVRIYNGTSPREPTLDSVPRTERYALLSIAGLTDWKNHDVLLEAMRIIVHKGSRGDVHLYIAGEGAERARIEEKIETFGLERHVFLLGNQKNIGSLLQRCDIYVHPAYAEAFGIAVAEAMMAGKPVIVANAGALPELVIEGVSGMVVDAFDASGWADAIMKLLDDERLCRTFAENAKVRAREWFSLETYVTNYRVLYEALLGCSDNR